MQLVYAWIDGYRNIINEEFNFGGKYTYTNNINSKQKTVVFERQLNPKYLPAFFSPNNKTAINNISAIVGENGSGKSNLINVLISILAPKFQEKNTLPKSYLVLLVDDNENLFYINHTFGWKLNFSFEATHLERNLNTKVILYHPTISLSSSVYTSDICIDISPTSILKGRLNDIKTSNFLLNNLELLFQLELSQLFKISALFKMKNQLSDTLLSPLSILEELKTFNISFDNDYNDFNRWVGDNENNFYEEIAELYRSEIQGTHSIKSENILDFYFAIFSFIRHGLRWNDNIDNYDLLRYIQKQKMSFISAVYTILNNFLSYGSNAIHVFCIKYSELFSNRAKLTRLEFSEFIDDFKDCLQQLNKNQSFNAIKSPFIFQWNSALSQGEISLLRLYSHILTGFEKCFDYDIEYNTRIKEGSILILLDEADVGFHLTWQKNFLSNLIDYISLLVTNNKIDYFKNRNIQVIYTTHSPISISDLPSSNVIFLKRKKNKSTVFTSRTKNIFAANVHELMADSFFLEDGTIGSFAKMKIQKVIDWCNNKKLLRGREEILKTINIIDEPIIRTKLREMYYAKTYDTATEENEIERIENEIKRLEQIKQEFKHKKK